MIFGLLLIVAYVAVVLFSRDCKPIKETIVYPLGGGGHMFTRLSEVQCFSNVDILFVGSSHSYRGFDTRVFADSGFHTFNLGSSNQSPMQTEYLLRKYLSQLNPKLVVFEVNPEAYEIDGVESCVDLIANHGIDFDIAKMALLTKDRRAINTLIYGAYMQSCHKRDSFSEETHRGTDTYISGGYVEHSHSSFKGVASEPHSITLRRQNLNSLRRCADVVAGINAQCLLVEAPVVGGLYNSYVNHGQFSDAMRSIGPYVDYNILLDIPDSLFYDNEHLNQPGVEFFNRQFISADSLINALKQSR